MTDPPPTLGLLDRFRGILAIAERRRLRQQQAELEARWLRDGERLDGRYREDSGPEKPVVEPVAAEVRPIDQELRRLAAAVLEQYHKKRIEKALGWKQRWQALGFRLGVSRQKGKQQTLWLSPRREMRPEDNAALQEYQAELLALLEVKK